MLKAVLFDLDGTLLDTLADLAASCNWALGQMNRPLRPDGEIMRFTGNGVRALCSRCLGEGASDDETDRMLDLFRTYYSAHLNDRTAPYPGIVRLLDRLRQEGIRRAVISNKYTAAAREICRTHFGDAFDVVMGEEKGVAKKPSPDGLLNVMRLLGVGPEDCVMVGDSDMDIEAGRRAGCATIGVTWGFRPREALENADRIVSTAQELEEAVMLWPTRKEN